MIPRFILIACAVAGILACDRMASGGGAAAAGAAVITLDTSGGSDAARILAGRLTDAGMARLRDVSQQEWENILRVTVEPNDSARADGALPPVAGRYSASDGFIAFSPLFPLLPGMRYRVTFDPSAAPLAQGGDPLVTVLGLPAREIEARTSVARILPTGDVWPENQLRIYIEFTAPMSRMSGLDHVKLLDAGGKEVKYAFLPLDADFWTPDAMRYTLFLDPGRVKQGILPNEQLGRALVSGNVYTLVVDSTWRDANGLPLQSSYRRTIRAEKMVSQRISLADVKVRVLDGRQEMSVEFGRPLDHGLMQRALGIRTARGDVVEGEGEVLRGETEWRFRAKRPLRAGEYDLLILSILEDGAGNRIDRAFEVDRFEQVDSTSKVEEYRVRFVVR